MVSLDDIRVGDVVKIVDRWCYGCKQNPFGLMDHWLGQFMTVAANNIHDGVGYVKMEEDNGEFSGDGWSWFPAAIECVVYNINDKDEDMEEIDASDLLSAIESMRKVDIWI